MSLRATRSARCFADRMARARLEAILFEYEAQARRDATVWGMWSRRLEARPQAAFRRATTTFGVRREEAKLDLLREVRPLLLEASVSGSAGGGDER